MKNIIEEHGSTVLGAIGAAVVIVAVIALFTDGGAVAERLSAIMGNAF